MTTPFQSRYGDGHGAPSLVPARGETGSGPWEDAVHAKAVELVRLALEMTTAAGSGHPTSAASLAHLVTVLLYDHMRWDPARPDHPASDRLVLSEGHACPIVYAAAADLGVVIGRTDRRPMTRADAMRLRAIDSPLDGHPNPVEGFPFFPAATGSLGQGLSLAAGLALAARLDGLSRRVFCLMGDGESREGQIWEALDFLVDHELSAVCPIFNANGQGQTGPVSRQQSPETLAAKLAAYGLEPLVFDGHDPGAIRDALGKHAERASGGRSRPVALVARTVKGWGSPSLASRTAGSHGKPAAEGAELEVALAELDREAARLGARWSEGTLHLRPIEGAVTQLPPVRAKGDLPSLPAALKAMGRASELEGGALATRKAYGVALRALGAVRPDLVVLDGDVSNSTYAELFAAGEGLAGRFFECRIAEQNMASCAAGLVVGGKMPFVSSFGKFVTRAYDQIEMALVGGLPLRLVGSHVGVGPAADGPSQMALPDVAWFAALGRTRRDGRPLIHVLTPCDAFSAYALTIEMAYDEGASYLRTLRQDVPLLYQEGDRFELGGHRVLREGRDVAIMAWGVMVHEALRASDALRARGISATVVDLYSLPFHGPSIVELARGSGGRVLTLEDNYGGGLGAAVAEALAEAQGPFTTRQMFIGRAPKSGRAPEDLLRALGLSADHVVEAARRLVGR